jgi:uncharacterized protein involved in exopolysaccharide biosynthesis
MTASPTAPGYVAISRRTLDVEDYIDLARRHAGWIAGPVLAGIVVSTVIAFSLPNVYISEAEMQITPATISESIVKTTVNQALTDRIILMENEILSRTSLSNIIQAPQLDLYKSDRASKPLEDVIDTMKGDIHIAIDSLPGEGSRRASAFSISFRYPDKIKAQATVQMLVTKFSDSDITTQRTTQNAVNSFVHDELSEAKAKLDQIDEDLTKFKVANSGKLPEQSNLNMAQLTSLQQQLTTANDSLNRLAQERLQLDTRLKTLQQQLQLFDMFDKETPVAAPVTKLQSEQLAALNKTIEITESNLAQLHQIFKPGYPDIRDAEARLGELKNQRDALQKKQDDDQARLIEAAKNAPAKKITTSRAEAERVTGMHGEIDATNALIQAKEMEHKNLQNQEAYINKQIDAVQAKLAATSGLEGTFSEMVANQRAASEKYQTLQKQQQLAEQSGALLERKAGETLLVLDPPSLPQQPAAPKRWMIIGAGTGIAFILGLVLAGVQEAKDTSLKNLKDVRAYTNLPVLSSIPLLENTMLVRRKRRIAYLAWSAAVIIGIMAVTASLYYHLTTTV